MAKAKKSPATKRHIIQAHKRAKALGRPKRVEPASRRADGSPQLGPGQVYATKTGQVFHPSWCDVVGAKWDQDPKGLLVVAESSVGERRSCKTCAVL